MNPPRLKLLSMHSRLPQAPCVVRLLEPPGTSEKSLWERLLNGTYDKPFIVDYGQRRFLHFDLNAVQSAMNLGSPDRLSLAYTRKMMSFLLFNRNPARILLLGLGGGSLAKYCYRQLPGSAVTAVEVNPLVIALRNEFRIPADDQRFRVVCASGTTYLECGARSKDVILMDACDREGIAPEFDTLKFYQQVRSCLSTGGVFVANLCSDLNRNAVHLGKIRAVFGEKYLTVRVKLDGNLIVIAFRDFLPDIDWKYLETLAVGLRYQFGLDFPRYVRRIALSRRLRSWELLRH